jgi:hypothetical protein
MGLNRFLIANVIGEIVMGTITLPEITIVGHPVAMPVSAADWFCEGFMFGWQHPDVEVPEAPQPLSEELLASYTMGTTSGQRAAKNIVEGYEDDGPGWEAAREGGIPYEKLEREWRDAWSEFLDHREEPHIENEPFEVPPPPRLVVPLR